MNTHGIPDVLVEMMARDAELLPAVVLSTSFPPVPASSLTLAPFATFGYVRGGNPGQLVYVTQPAHSVTLTGGNGTYWLALHSDTATAVVSWTRQAGTHYLWQSSGTLPADPLGALVFLQVLVTGGVISAVTPVVPATGPPMSTQNSTAVAITGGTLEGLTGVVLNGTGLEPGRLVVRDAPPGGTSALRTQTASGAGRYQLFCEGTAPHYLNGIVGIQAPNAAPPDLMRILHRKANQHALTIQPSDNDTGTGIAVLFQNVAGTPVGSITTTGAATAYNTTSDGRLKEGLETLTGALATVEQLLPVRFRWKADASPGVGFVAQDVLPVVPEAVTGTPDAREPMGMDMSKLVPYLTACIKELLTRCEALEARLLAIEGGKA